MDGNNFYDIVEQRALRSSPSPPSSPILLSPEPKRTRSSGRTRKRKDTKADLAGLVSGDSDSSALTESGDDNEAAAANVEDSPVERRGTSVATGTDGGTEEPQEDDDTSPGRKKYSVLGYYYSWIILQTRPQSLNEVAVENLFQEVEVAREAVEEVRNERNSEAA